MDNNHRNLKAFIAAFISLSWISHRGCMATLHELVLCKGITDNIICPQNVITILYASYGRHDNRTCPGPEMKNTNCYASNSFSYVSGQCDGQSTCSLYAHRDNFGGDPCYGTAKYLIVENNCRLNGVIKSFHSSVICSNNYGSITCDAGVIEVTFANYGRLDGYTCPFWKQTATNCHAADSFSVVSAICDGMTQCTLTASASSFLADNCDIGIYRYLTVHYTCGGFCPDDMNSINSTGTLIYQNGTNENDILNYECQHGVRSGNLQRTCQSDGTWSGIEPDCEVVCPNDTRITNSTGALTKISGYNENDNLTYECQHGVKSGDLKRRCKSDGTWSGTEPDCVVVCTNDSSIINSTEALTNISGYNENDKLTYECQHGVISGDLERRCLKNGTWSGSEPQCEVICSNLTNEINSSGTLINVTGYSYYQHDVLTYRCHNDIISGNAQRFCLSDGTWSGSEPACGCLCPCETTTNTSVSYFKDNFETLILKLKINKKETSKVKRSLISAKDDRPSCQSMGGAAIVLIVMVILTIVIPDVTRMYVFCKSINKK